MIAPALRLLPRFLPHGLVILALIAAIWRIDQAGYRRARQQAEQERLVTAIMLMKAARASEARLATMLDGIDRRRASDTARLTHLHETVIRPTIQREILRETRLSDPAAGLTDGLRTALNRALGAVACTARADGGIDCALPAPADDPQQ